MSGKNIAVTHSTFANANDDTLKYLRDGNYTLILDEVLDILIGYNTIASKKISAGDPKLLIDKNVISVDEVGKVTWISNDAYEKTTFADIKRLADRGNLFYLDESLFVWEFPAEVFNAFDEAFVMTYLFDGSYLKPYFGYSGIDYELMTLVDGELVPYQPTPIGQLQRIRSLINLDTDKRRNNYDNYSLSKNWFLNNKSDVDGLRKCIKNYVTNITKAKATQIMWTAFEDEKQKKIKSSLKDNGYRIRTPTATELEEIYTNKHLTEAEKNKALERAKQCYVSNNARASNEYRERNVVIYALNYFPNKYVERYFSLRGYPINKDMISLGVMIQFIWRSAIRDDKPISLYVPSTRMRTLLMKWLSGQFSCGAIAA